MGHHCCSKQKVKRGLWSPEEDEKLVRHISNYGHGCWSSVPKLAGSFIHSFVHFVDFFLEIYLYYSLRPINYRATEVREKLQIEMDKLSSTRLEEGFVHRRRGTNHHRRPQDARQQVGSNSKAFARKDR